MRDDDSLALTPSTVVAPVADPFDLRRHLRSLLSELPFSKDILVSDPAHFAEYRTYINTVYHDAAEEGFPVWQAGEVDHVAIQIVCRYRLETV